MTAPLETRGLDVSIGTVKLICITRGRRSLAITLALCEVTIWLPRLHVLQ